MNDRQRLEAIVSVVCKYLPPDGICIEQAMNEIIGLIDPLPPVPCVPDEQMAQPEQEPVAWFTATPIQGNGNRVLYEQVSKQYNGTPDTAPLYTTPPQRTWVGLTDEEVEMLVENKCADPSEQIRFVEAKLKEKNTK